MRLYMMKGKNYIPSHGGKVYLHNQMAGSGVPLLLEKDLGVSSPYTESELSMLKQKVNGLKITTPALKKKKYISL